MFDIAPRGAVGSRRTEYLLVRHYSKTGTETILDVKYWPMTKQWLEIFVI